jgi:hypothetical protein|tara:strand:+ start:1385 stop:1768 length:384 start_codon:yes stop_codon:yes gene_type:complete
MTELKDWLNSINQSKVNIIDEIPDTESKYLPFIVNKCLSGHLDAVIFANEMNINHHLDKKLQYDFLLNTLRSKKRFSPWVRREEMENLEIVKKYYGYSTEKAKQAVSILSDEQLTTIRKKLDTGGTR